MSFAFPWSSNRTTRTGLRLAALCFIMALVGMSVANAATLSPVQNISNDTAESIWSKVAQGPNGNLHLVWDSLEGERVVRYARGIWNNTTGSYNWQASHIVARAGNFANVQPIVTVAPNNVVTVAWSDGTIRLRQWNANDPAPSGNIIPLGSGIQANLYPDSNSNVHIVWNGDFRLQYCEWNGGSCVTRLTFEDSVNASNRPDVAVDNNNNVHIVSDTGPRSYYRSRVAGTVAFSGPVDIGGGNFPEIAADGQGVVHIVRSGSFNIIYCSKTINTACANEHVMDADDDIQPSIGATRAGSVVVAFVGKGNTVWYDALENGKWQGSFPAGNGVQVDVAARPYSSCVSITWNQDYEIRHLFARTSPAVVNGQGGELNSSITGSIKIYLPFINHTTPVTPPPPPPFCS